MSSPISFAVPSGATCHISLPAEVPAIMRTIVATSRTAPIAGSMIVEPRLARAAKNPPTNEPAAQQASPSASLWTPSVAATSVPLRRPPATRK